MINIFQENHFLNQVKKIIELKILKLRVELQLKAKGFKN